jgi:hypothetical protein
MVQLVPCPQCGRHVRLSSTSCPFCDVALDVSGLSEHYAPRRVTAQSGIKRATMFALGASVVAACSTDPGQPVPVYGAPVSPTSDETSSVTSEAPATSESDTTSPAFDTDAGETSTSAPLTDATSPSTNSDADAPADAGDHDADAEHDAGSSSVDGGAVDTSADAALPDDTSGVIAQPPYGAPFPLPDDRSDGMAQPVYGAPSLNE